MSNARFAIVQSRAVSDRRLSDELFRTLSAFGMFSDRDGWCFPSQTTIAAILGVSRKTVNERVMILVDLGYMEKKNRFHEKTGLQLSSMYRLLFDTPAAVTDQEGNGTPAVTDQEGFGTPAVTDDEGEGYTNVPSNVPINVSPEREIILQSLRELAKRKGTRHIVDRWIRKHSLQWILQAVDLSHSKGAKSIQYTERILKDWEENGYPTGSEQASERPSPPKVDPEKKLVTPAMFKKNTMPDFDENGRVIIPDERYSMELSEQEA